MTEEHKATFAEAYGYALRQCVRDGTTPDDLWLGPDMRDELQEYAKTMVGDTLALSSFNDGKMRYDGLKIRFMESNGLRVGKSFSPDGS